MKGILTKDVTNQKFWLVTVAGYAFGIRLNPDAAKALRKVDGDIAVDVAGDGNVAVAGRTIGRLIGWNNQPIEAADSEAAWTLVTESGRPGRLGRALQRAVKEGRLLAAEATAWVRKYLGEDSATDLQALLNESSANEEEEELLEILRQHLLNHGEEGDLPPW